MDWQTIAIAILIAAAVGYIGRQTWRTWHPSKTGCGGGCACGKTSADAVGNKVTLIPSEQLTIRPRSASRP